MTNKYENCENNLVELNIELEEGILCNNDISPTKIKDRHWSKFNIAALWIGMAVCIPTYMLAASILSSGMNWLSAILTILLGNLIVLIPMMLNAHPGTKYGIPFPVLSRASFGIYGTHIPALLRGLVACGWFGIQCWIGGIAIYELLVLLFPSVAKSVMLPIGINLGQFLSFLFFWAINVGIVIKGIESIRWLEDWAAPVLIIIGIALLIWAIFYGGGMANVLKKSDVFTKPAVSINNGNKYTGSKQIKFNFQVLKDDNKARPEFIIISQNNKTDENKILNGKKLKYQDEIIYNLDENVKENDKVSFYIQFIKGAIHSSVQKSEIIYNPGHKESKSNQSFWALFFPVLTAMVGYWATLSLNIPDFTRYAKSQKEQAAGQLIGLPTTMAFYSFIGLAATSAGIIIFKDILIASDAPWDPVNLLAHFKNPILVFIAMFALAIATLSTNLAANVVAPANGFSNLWPEKISFKAGGIITGLIGLLMFPWKLIENTQGYIFTWLIGYSALLGPIAGIVIADYYIIRKTKISLYDLYQEKGKYYYTKGVNMIAILAIILGILPNVPGFLVQAGFINAKAVPSFFNTIYIYAWFVGFFISFFIYSIGMKLSKYPKD